MRSNILISLILWTAVSFATPITHRDLFLQNTANDMSDTIASPSTHPCRPVALIFARGTFDSGNVGVWVGPQLISSLRSLLPPSSLAAQGVNASAYPATLLTYLDEGGSNDGAASLASTVTEYANTCPDSAIVVSGWSQGALVARKGIALLRTELLANVAGVVTFGDPWHLFSEMPPPKAIKSETVKGFCFTGLTLDPLCAQLPDGYEVPEGQEAVEGAFSKLPTVPHAAQKLGAATSLATNFPKQLMQSWDSFKKTLKSGNWVRLFLTPQHFEYGNIETTREAAEFIMELPMVKAVRRQE